MNINQNLSENILKDFFARQLASWDLVRTNVESLKTQIVTRHIPYKGVQLEVQFNPARIVSTGAKIDKKSIVHRSCFLCAEHRPEVQQEIKVFDNISVLLNPYPILPSHLTIVSKEHVPQHIGLFEKSIGLFAEMLPSHIIFYNGPRCGASAPDHAHLQAGAKGYVPIERDWETYRPDLELLYLYSTHHPYAGVADVSFVHHYACPAFTVQSDNAEINAKLLHRLIQTICQVTLVDEADINVLAWKHMERLVTVVFVRSKHRPVCYTAEGDAQILVSPGSIDMGGLLITPRQEDYNRITPEKAYEIIQEVSASEEVFRTIATQIKNWD